MAIWRAAIGSLALISIVGPTSAAVAQGPSLVAVPFVGCASDGQMGPGAAPIKPSVTPTVPKAAASQLAYYGSMYLGVLAPKGWHCFSLSGSGGDSLFVTPESHNAKDLLDGKTKLKGPAVELLRINGGTSGRFEVAAVVARLFPSKNDFVQQVIDEGLVENEAFPSGPYPDDKLVRWGDTRVDFVTPANHGGMGTYDKMAINGQPISGIVILLPDQDMNLVKLDVRLPPETRHLRQAIITAVKKSNGLPPPHDPS